MGPVQKLCTIKRRECLLGRSDCFPLLRPLLPVIVSRSITPACSSYLDTNNAASDITHGVVADLNATEEFPARGLSPADVKADGMARLPSARGEETKKNRKWRFLPKIGKIAKIRMKLFKTKGEPKSHPEQDALPTKRHRETRISQNAECEVPEVPSTSPPKEDLTITLAPAPQESQSRKRPLIVRVVASPHLPVKHHRTMRSGHRCMPLPI
eukprot:XP_014042669.1 PREDICTED: uncharacterized protein LOC106595845 isoform X4 [Salmo salar]